MIRIKIKNLKKINKNIPAFITLSIPIMCLAMIMFIKMFSLMCLVVIKQKQAIADETSMEKIKSGILNYMKNQGTLPPIKDNGEIDYNYHISHYIPPNYRLDHENKPFKLIIYNKKFINDLNKNINNNEETEDINLICRILPTGKNKFNKKVTIYFGDLENAGINTYENNNTLSNQYNNNHKINNTNSNNSISNIKHLFIKKDKNK